MRQSFYSFSQRHEDWDLPPESVILVVLGCGGSCETPSSEGVRNHRRRL